VKQDEESFHIAMGDSLLCQVG